MATLALALDLTYTAAVLPLLLAFGLVRAFNAAYILEAAVGALFAADLLLSLHVGYMARFNQSTHLVMDGKQVGGMAAFEAGVDGCRCWLPGCCCSVVAPGLRAHPRLLHA